MNKTINAAISAVAVASIATIGFTSAVSATDYIVPTQKEECKEYGWVTLIDDQGNLFKNQGDCVSFTVPQKKIGLPDTD